ESCQLRNADFGLRIEEELLLFNPQSTIRNPRSGDPLNLMRLVPPKGETDGETVPSLPKVCGAVLLFQARSDGLESSGRIMSQTTETAEKRSDKVNLPNSRKVYI